MNFHRTGSLRIRIGVPFYEFLLACKSRNLGKSFIMVMGTERIPYCWTGRKIFGFDDVAVMLCSLSLERELGGQLVDTRDLWGSQTPGYVPADLCYATFSCGPAQRTDAS
ncbi:MAG: hypothetical protein Ct9H300mP11_14330 [Chloroflexota bacterium]|nr:MAG: hypothetical protein Ct9H300mP11_14330 [Chloroflexota bacterium]